MEDDEESIFSKVPEWKPLFLLKTKIKTQATQMANIIYLSRTFRMSELIQEMRKKNLHWSIIGKISLHIEESEQGEEFANKFGLF